MDGYAGNVRIKMSILKNRKLIKKQLARKFKSRCYVCHRPFGKGFVFHHRFYDGTEPDFNTDQNKYFDHVFAQIRKNPRQFLLLCHAHHYFVEWAKRISDDKFKRFLKARRMSK